MGARLALVAGSLAAAVAGWVVAREFGNEETASTARSAVALYDCPAEGGRPIGQVQAGDQLWVIGVTDDRWAVVRHPTDSNRPAWVALAQLDTDADSGDVPTLSCAAAMETVGSAPSDSAQVATTIPGTTTTAVLATTTSAVSTTSSTSTTVVTDLIPPVVTVTSDREWLYVLTGVEPCASESVIIVTIEVADPTVPLTIRSIVANWNAPAGPQTANLTPVGGNRFSLQIPTNGPAGGET
ncbi:MAG: SH3 domain-containing protein, partial [Actinomycetota bacterium]|nr:SH3 domain-containing protein [Actinomycetota bacterium]